MALRLHESGYFEFYVQVSEASFLHRSWSAVSEYTSLSKDFSGLCGLAAFRRCICGSWLTCEFDRWVYLFFFNTLWVWLPLWIMYEAYQGITSSLSQKEVVNVISYLEKKAD